ncbi:hypothetical protein GCM10010390_85540 [Streptomyces mordarskii]|uniref:Uncharacterized protein n=1 Tax=Streptomyces mordarskii TaxID=1226758 RepID=A0ABN1ELV1_9ACTN
MCRTAVSHRSSGSSTPSVPDRPDHADHMPDHRAHPDRPTALTADRTPAPPRSPGFTPSLSGSLRISVCVPDPLRLFRVHSLRQS